MVWAQDSGLAPRGMEALGATATLRNDFTFDAAMLGVASQMLPEEDRPIIAKLRSISVHNFRFPATGYDPGALEALRAQYAGHGWNHLVTKQTHPPTEPVASAPMNAAGNASGEAGAAQKPFDPTRTDVWARMANGDFDGMVLMVANEHNVNLVVIDGMISPLELLHLRGHFGIPRFGGDGFESRQ